MKSGIKTDAQSTLVSAAYTAASADNVNTVSQPIRTSKEKHHD